MKLASLQPSVTVIKGKISFATMTHGCKRFFPFATVTDSCEEVYFMVFSHYIYENEQNSENMYLTIILAKKSQFHFSFFKVESRILNLVQSTLSVNPESAPSDSKSPCTRTDIIFPPYLRLALGPWPLDTLLLIHCFS